MVDTEVINGSSTLIMYCSTIKIQIRFSFVTGVLALSSSPHATE
jgi:hypothetical protein